MRASFGYTIYHANSDVTDLLKQADDAMYANKHAKRALPQNSHNAA
ncbi:diguanylate cyclase [Thalassospira sp.]|nr:diguanylate cyclase [Thalassospira sp.]